jgi:hypothetical protein
MITFGLGLRFVRPSRSPKQTFEIAKQHCYCYNLRPDDLFALELSLNFVLRIAKISLLFLGISIFNLKGGGDSLSFLGWS